jgi:multidrug resistance efflux pump
MKLYLSEKAASYLWTALAVAIAVLFLALLWEHYFVAPWTRDGRIRAEVVKIAPEVSGTVTQIRVVDNQFVHKGDVLFVIDPIRFQLALAHAQAEVEQRSADKKIKDIQATRRNEMAAEAVPLDEKQSFQSVADIASGSYDEATADLNLAQLNLQRSVLRSPVNGYVTNLTLRVGDFATAETPQLALVDSDSFFILGYFEETKLRRIRDGARATVRLMEGGPAIEGHVEGLSRGITDLNSDPGREGLADVNPVFTWVRLAQRIPVRIHIDRVPAGLQIASGLTCTITIDESHAVVPPNTQAEPSLTSVPK